MVGEDSDTITQMIERIVLYRKERSRATNVFGVVLGVFGVVVAMFKQVVGFINL